MTAPLDDPQEQLFRQVHPSFLREDRVSSQAFKPTPKDEKQLSVARGAVTDAIQAYLLHVREKELCSAGTWTVTVGEALDEGLPTLPDPLTDPVHDPAHAFIDYRDCESKGAIERKASKLAEKARARGRLHP